MLQFVNDHLKYSLQPLPILDFWRLKRMHTQYASTSLDDYWTPDKHFSYFSIKTYVLGRRGASNGYPQHKFSWRNKKNINIFWPEKKNKRTKMALYCSDILAFRFRRRFSRWWPWLLSWISHQNNFSYFLSTSHPDASYQVYCQLAFQFRRTS